MATTKKSSRNGSRIKRFFDAFKVEMTPEGKSLMLKCLGIAVFVFAVFSLVAAVSYLFTWKQDQNLVSQAVFSGEQVANLGGSLGLKWGSFLVADFLGLGSFAFIFLLGFYAIRLFFWKMEVGVVRISLVTVSGAFIVSLALSFIGSDTLFGGGLGGDAGQAVVNMMSTAVGPVVSYERNYLWICLLLLPISVIFGAIIGISIYLPVLKTH